MSLAVAKVEFGLEALSDTTPTWVDISDRVESVTWKAGKDSDTDGLEPGEATIVIDNGDRFLEPDYSASPWYPNIRPLRRFRLTVTADAANYQQGTFYAQSWKLLPSDVTSYGQVQVDCVDGIGLLNNKRLPVLDPPTAQSYGDVVEFDKPWGHWPLDEASGRKMGASTGPEGSYRGTYTLGVASPILGDPGLGVLFGGDNVGATGFGRVALDDSGVWHDAGEITGEIVVEMDSLPDSVRVLIGGPLDSGAGDWSFRLAINDVGQLFAWVYTGSNVLAEAVSAVGAVTAPGRYHVAFTYDGAQLLAYLNGSVVASQQKDGGIVNPDANEFLAIGGGQDSVAGETMLMAHAAVYDYALGADRIAAHADAALTRGFDAETTGDRVAEVATNPLWSTAGITLGQILTMLPAMQIGQTRLSEIERVLEAEQPHGLFWFDDDGNPAYQGYDYDATPLATFSDSASDVLYDDIETEYDDDLSNSVTTSRPGGLAQVAEDAASISEFDERDASPGELPLVSDSDALLVARGLLEPFSQPMLRVTRLDLVGMTADVRAQILQRDIGDVIRVKGHTDTGEPFDVITRIIEKQKSISSDDTLRCSWSLARGFDASDTHWHLGVTGFGELGSTNALS